MRDPDPAIEPTRTEFEVAITVRYPVLAAELDSAPAAAAQIAATVRYPSAPDLDKNPTLEIEVEPA